MVMYAILANIAVNVAFYLIRDQPESVYYVFYPIAICAIGFAMFSMFKLSMEFGTQGSAVLHAVLMIIPCLSLLILLFMNQQATTFLDRNGIKVGLLGADLKKIT